jgi:phenylpyruvate tautomerase PptA (4-oxalocrotonate tautomerase family)
MPMIDIYATAGTFPDIKKLVTAAAALVEKMTDLIAKAANDGATPPLRAL